MSTFLLADDGSALSFVIRQHLGAQLGLHRRLRVDLQPENAMEEIWLDDITWHGEYVVCLKWIQKQVHAIYLARMSAEGSTAQFNQAALQAVGIHKADMVEMMDPALQTLVERVVPMVYVNHIKLFSELSAQISFHQKERDRILANFDKRRREKALFELEMCEREMAGS